jgi:hypothetical protein
VGESSKRGGKVGFLGRTKSPPRPRASTVVVNGVALTVGKELAEVDRASMDSTDMNRRVAYVSKMFADP